MPTRPLGDLAELTVGHVGPMAAEYVSDGVPFLRSLNIRPFRVELEDVRFIGREFHQRLKKSALRPGDVVVVRTGEPGTAAVIPASLPEANCSDLVIVRPHPGLDSRYLAYLINGVSRGFVNSRTVGAVQQHFNVGAARELPVPDLPLHEQQGIAGVLGALDDLIDTNRHAIDAIARLSRLAFASCARSAQANAPLGSVASVSARKTSPGKGTIRYLDIASLGDGYINWPDPITWDVAPSRARRLASSGATLWSTVRPNRRAHALLVSAPEDLVVSTGIAVLEPVMIGPAFLYAATDDRAFVDQLVSRADGSAYPAVRGNAFESATIPLPTAGELARFESALWPLWNAAADLDLEARSAAAARDELLPLLISGRVRVGDVAA